MRNALQVTGLVLFVSTSENYSYFFKIYKKKKKLLSKAMALAVAEGGEVLAGDRDRGNGSAIPGPRLQRTWWQARRTPVTAALT